MKNAKTVSDCANETLQSCSKTEVPRDLHCGLQKTDRDNVCYVQSYIYESEREDKAPNPETEPSALISNVKSSVLLSDNMTSNKEELHPTTPIPSMNAELMSVEVQSADCEPEKKNCSSKTAEDTEMGSETDVDMLMSEDVAGPDICHGDAVNNLCKPNTPQSLDQMVPAYYEPTTILPVSILLSFLGGGGGGEGRHGPSLNFKPSHFTICEVSMSLSEFCALPHHKFCTFMESFCHSLSFHFANIAVF